MNRQGITSPSSRPNLPLALATRRLKGSNRPLSIELRAMKIDLLKYHPQHIPALAAWFKAESPEYFQNQSLEQIAHENFVARLNDEVLPISFLAHEGASPIGTVALLEESITTHRHLQPWVAGLHVDPAFRHRGVGMSLVQAAVERAIALGFPCLYAGISRAEEHYLARGWEVFEKVMYYGKPLSIIRLDLARGAV
jgi:GNAT superfamily N-acetyltransferase